VSSAPGRFRGRAESSPNPAFEVLPIAGAAPC
jgi:hypothetical protein